MEYLLDTDFTADLLAGHKRAVQVVQPLVPQGLAISLVTYGEIYEGVYFGRDPKGSEAAFRRMQRLVEVLDLNRSIMKRFARIRGDLRRQGNLIPDPDIMIAATALHHGLTLVTRNRRHYDRVPGLKLYP